jgi:hypothetical protein
MEEIEEFKGLGSGWPLALLFVSVASTGFSVSVGRLESTDPGRIVSVDFKGFRRWVGWHLGNGAQDYPLLTMA